jgi:iron complex transport system substrate-binding protein
MRAFAAALLLAGALRAPAAGAYPLRVVDDSGASLTLAARPRRIVSLTLFSDEVLLQLLGPDRLLGVTTFSTDPAVSNVAAQAAEVPHRLTMNVELLVSLAPDLVIVASWTDPDSVRQLRDAGIPVYLVSSPVTFDEIRSKVVALALLVGEGERGRALVAAMDRELADVAARVAKIPASRRLSVIDWTPWGAAQGRGSSWDEIVRAAGLTNAADSVASDRWGQVPLSKERLLELDPDVLVLPGWVSGDPKGGADAFYRATVRDPALEGLRAVRTGRVYEMPERLRTTTSQYIADAVRWLAETAYPERFR